jgi:hypothetical protein
MAEAGLPNTPDARERPNPTKQAGGAMAPVRELGSNHQNRIVKRNLTPALFLDYYMQISTSLRVLMAAMAPLVGCFNMGATPATTPDHAANSPAQWAALESQARNNAAASGGTPAHAKRLIATGMEAVESFSVKAGNCYAVALVWSFGGAAHLTLGYAQPDGKSINDQSGGQSKKITVDAPAVSACADHDGALNVRVSALDASGALVTSSLLEYAVAISEKPEAPEAAAARRSGEAQRVGAEVERREQNVAAAAAEHAKDARIEAQLVQNRCGGCVDKLTRCRVVRAGRPKTGVTYGADTSCERDYHACQWGDGVTAFKHPGEYPCGNP